MRMMTTMSGNEEKYGSISKNEYDALTYVLTALVNSIELMRKANDFQELASGYGAETYGETITNLIKGITGYLRRSPVERE